MKDLLWNFFRTGPDIAQIADSEAVKKKFNSMFGLFALFNNLY